MGTTVWSRYWRVGSPCRSCFTRLLLVPDPLLVPSLLLEVSSSNDLFVPSELTPDTTPEDSGITQSWLMLKTKSIIVNIGLFYLRTWWLQPGFNRAADRGGRAPRLVGDSKPITRLSRNIFKAWDKAAWQQGIVVYTAVVGVHLKGKRLVHCDSHTQD